MKVQFTELLGFRFAIVILVSILVTALTLESMTFRLSGFIYEANPSVRFTNFSIITAICMSMEFIMVGILRKKVKTIGLLPLFKAKDVFMIILAVQLVMFCLVLATLIEMQYLTKYHTVIIRICVMTGYSFGSIFILLLLVRLSQWWRVRHSLVVLAYILTTGTIILNFSSGIIYLTDELENDPNLIRPLPFPPHMLHVEKGDGSLKNLYNGSYTLVFVCTWVATVILLRSYSQRLGRVRYWITVILPLVYFLVQYEPYLINRLASYRLEDPLIYNALYVLFINASKPIGGIMFGIGFILISRRLESKAVKEYLVLSGMGFMLMFACNQPDILTTPTYPPYGILGLSALPISSFLIQIGIYSMAVSISQDASLRRGITRSLAGDALLLESLGNSELQQSIKRKVFTTTKRLSNQLPEDTGIESSLDDLDIKRYINEVYDMLKEDKNKKQLDTTDD